MSDGERIDVEISANESKLASGMRAAVDAVKGGTEGMKGALEGVGAAFEAVMAPLAAFIAVLAGGAFLKESVEETVNFYKESGKLGKQLGITATEAGVLRTALGDVYSSTEQFSGAASMLTRQVKQNEEGIKKMGLETRNSDGSFRNSKDLMLDAIKVLNGYKEGTDRNMAAQTLFGRGASNLGGLLKLNNEVLEEAKKKQEALGLTITQEGVEAVNKYRAAMNDAGDVMEGVSQTIGTAVLPIFTQLAQWFADIGPAVVAVFKGAIDVLVAVLQVVIDIVKDLWDACSAIFSDIASLVSDAIGGEATTGMFTWTNALKVVKIALLELKAVVELVIEVIRGFIQVTIADFQMWSKIVNAALHLDWNGIAAEYKAGTTRIEQIVIDSANRIKKNTQAIMAAAVGVVAGTDTKSTPTSGSGGGVGENFTGGGKGAGSAKSGGHEQTRTSKWQNELDQQKLAHERMNQENGTFYEFSKEREAEYWKHILETVNLSAKEKVEVERKYLDLALGIRKQAFDDHIAGLKLEMDAFRNNMDERLRIASEIASEMKQRFGETSKEYKQAQGEIVKIEQAKADQLQAIRDEIRNAEVDAQTDAVAAKQAQTDKELQLGLITQKEVLQREVQYQNDLYQIQLQALQEKLALMEKDPDKNPVEYQKLKDDILQIEREHQAQLRQIETQSAVLTNATRKNAVDQLSQSWSQNLAKMLTLQQGFANTLKNIWGSIVGVITGALAKMIEQYIAKWLASLLIKKATGGAERAAEVVGLANVAAAAAFASTAAIPIVGPALAPGAAAAALAATMSFLPGASAAKGYDIPAGVNPITQLHQKEMVLPAEQAEVIRAMAAGGKGGREPNITINLHALDGNSVQRVLMDNKAALVSAVKSAVRDGVR